MLGADGCEEYPGRDCVQSVIVDADGLPFATWEGAKGEADGWPAWTTPHIIIAQPSRGGSRLPERP